MPNTRCTQKATGMIMKIPYGLSNFKDILEQGYLYIDKTVYIRDREKSKIQHLTIRNYAV